MAALLHSLIVVYCFIHFRHCPSSSTEDGAVNVKFGTLGRGVEPSSSSSVPEMRRLPVCFMHTHHLYCE